MGVLETLAESKVPAIYGKLARRGLVDAMTIIRPTEAQDSGGSVADSDDEVLFENVPVQIEARRRYTNNVAGNQQSSISNYDLTFQLVQGGGFINITPDCKLVVAARGLIPERVFNIEAIQNEGVNWLASCNEK